MSQKRWQAIIFSDLGILILLAAYPAFWIGEF